MVIEIFYFLLACVGVGVMIAGIECIVRGLYHKYKLKKILR